MNGRQALGRSPRADRPVPDQSTENASARRRKRLFTLASIRPAPLNGDRSPSMRHASRQYLAVLDVGGSAGEGSVVSQTPITSLACASLFSQAMKVRASFEGVRHLG